MPSTHKETVKKIRRIVKSEYDYIFTYNDRVKSGRRIKMMCNGYMHKPATYEKWDRNIKRKLKRSNITVKSAGFEVLFRPYYGEYIAYVVRI